MKRKGLALFLVLAMVLTSMTCLGWAAEKEDITVYVTLSNRGEIAYAEGRAMAQVPVTVEANEKGYATVDEVLQVFHKTYMPDGYVVTDAGGYTSVCRLWGVDTYNTLFFINDKGLTSAVTEETVTDGDRITASVNSDDQYYSDYYGFFTKMKYTGTAGETVTVKLTAFSGMMPADPQPVADAQLYLITDSGLQALEGVRTDEKGQAVITLDETFTAGKTCMITAKGTVPAKVTVDWTTGETMDADAPLIAPVCQVKVQSRIAAGVKNTKIISIKATAGKSGIRISWTKSKGYKVDGYEIYRGKKSTQMSRYDKGIKKTSYTNAKYLKKGTRYYYKVRGYRTVDGEKVYTAFSKTVSARAK